MPPDGRDLKQDARGTRGGGSSSLTGAEVLAPAAAALLEATEPDLIRARTIAALQQTGGNVRAAAALLGVTRRTVYLRMARWPELEKARATWREPREPEDAGREG